MVGRHDRIARDPLVVVVLRGVHVAYRVAIDDNLCSRIAVRFEQHRIHIGARCHTSGLRLQCLGAADLAAIAGYGAVERHVLWLERRYTDIAAPQHAAQRSGQRALASV